MKKIDIVRNEIVNKLLESKLAEKKEFMDETNKQKYFVLITPNALEKEFACVVALGYPEKTGIWSYTLLKKKQLEESSMKPYFQAFKENDWGLVVINPHHFGADYSGEKYLSQLETVLKAINSTSKLGFIGFSMGGDFIIEFLRINDDLLERTTGIVFIDPALKIKNKRDFLKNIMDKIILFAANSDNSLGNIVARRYNLSAILIDGIHGEIPNKSLNHIIEFYKKAFFNDPPANLFN